MRSMWLPCFLTVTMMFWPCQEHLMAREGNPKTDYVGNRSPHSLATAGEPVVERAVHNRGNIQLVVNNNGTWGTFGQTVADPFTGEGILSSVYPRNSNVLYLWVAAFWIGAVVGRDTLVSVGTEDFYEQSEFWPDLPPFGSFTYSSIDRNSPFYSPDAFSEEDIYCEYTDTLTDPNLVTIDSRDQRPHKPLNIKISQRSMAWSYSYADDFILFDFQIQNIGRESLNDLYVGIFVDGDAWHQTRRGPQGWDDDIVGFYRTHPAPEGCGFIDTINIAYIADNDGDPTDGSWDSFSARSAVGMRVVRTPSDSLRYAYNWWIINYSDATRDFGPRRQGTPENPFRKFGPRLGTPLGDKNRYYVMRQQEFDYDLMFTAVDHSFDGWLAPPPEAADYASGWDARYLLSFGPFDVAPGQRLPLSIAYVGGADLHKDPTAFARVFDPKRPDIFYNTLDFSNLAANSRWASWVYDNPGVDTDGDNYRGKFRICAYDSAQTGFDTIVNGIDTSFIPVFEYTAADTFYYEGDGVPDFRGAGPPPTPPAYIIPGLGKLTIRWNGYYSENTPDIFSRLIDFEGYRVYLGLDDRPASLSMLVSYDLENYNRYQFKIVASGGREWVLEEIPFKLDSLRILFNDPNFDPLIYTITRPLDFGGELYYFTKQDFNVSDISARDGISKVYPNATRPVSDPSQWQPDELTFEHDEPLPKYYEYEYVIDDLLPTVPYYVGVTTFDFGSPISGLPALETNPSNNLIMEFAQTPSDTVMAKGLDAYVYPNPYRVDANYDQRGFENRFGVEATERARRLHFANLPNVCKIHIYTPDGDLVRLIDHSYPNGGPGSMHDTWDLITRNQQAVVSGLYYFVVESQTRTQIGKFVIIK